MHMCLHGPHAVKAMQTPCSSAPVVQITTVPAQSKPCSPPYLLARMSRCALAKHSTSMFNKCRRSIACQHVFIGCPAMVLTSVCSNTIIL